ncbi:thiamine phosphate synthase [Halobacteriales archaeon QS_3_64_16]|nr:MAG: thiamine phosphate synthase [Halobacteriales archaeon QS_3_64_16]
MNSKYGTYLVTQEDRSAGRSTLEVVEAAIAGGIDVVQLREKNTTARERYDLGREVRDRTAEAEISLIVNDRVDLALAIDAEGVHLGEDDLPVSVARELLGEEGVIGRSVSTVAAAREAEAAGADYLGVGAVFATRSKDVTDEQAEIGVERVRAIAESVLIPVVAIGGIEPANAADAVAAGADGVAAISVITAAEDPAAATRELGEAVAAGREER